MPIHTKVSALVLNWKDTERTLRCVRSLLQSPIIEFVLVVDNESSNNGDIRARLQELDHSRIELLSLQDNRGFAGGVNPGITKLVDDGFDDILVINNDATIDPQSVEELVLAQNAAAPLTLVGPMIVYPSGEVQTSGSCIHWSTAKVNHLAAPDKIDYLTWACVLISKEIIGKIGLLDEQFFMYWEDADYALRLTEAGGHLKVVNDAVAIHEESATRQVIGNLTVRYATASMAKFAHKYPRLSFGARYRLLMRIVRQSLRHGLSEGRSTFEAWRWGRIYSEAPAWKSIKEARWTH